MAHSRTRGLKLPGWQPSVKADVTVGGNCTPNILMTADVEQIWRGHGPDLDGMVGTLNGLLERTHS